MAKELRPGMAILAMPRPSHIITISGTHLRTAHGRYTPKWGTSGLRSAYACSPTLHAPIPTRGVRSRRRALREQAVDVALRIAVVAEVVERLAAAVLQP